MSLFDLSNVIEDLATESVDVEMPAAATYVDGDAVFADPEIVNLPHVNIVPASSRDISRLPEGDRTGEIVRVLSELELPVLSVKDKRRGAIIRRNDRRYEVFQAGNWSAAGNFHKSFARKIEEG